MKDELISRNALIKALKDSGIPCHADINEIIMTAPTVEARARGTWITKTLDPEFMDCICSNCRYRDTYSIPVPFVSTDFKKFRETDYWSSRNYCPNCGADMRGEDE